jgi:hypothetical protein
MSLAARPSCGPSDGGETSMSDGDEKNDVLDHEWTTLRSLWDRCSSTTTTVDPALRAELEGYFSGARKPSEGGGWDELNRAEQIVGMYLGPDQIRIEYDNLLELAQSRKLPSIATFKCYKVQFFGPGGTLDDQRLAYLSLLYSLQSVFVEARFERKLRKVTARRLLTTGIVLIIGTMALHLTMQLIKKPGGVDLLTLVIVATMGILGAFFSRVATFQTSFSTLRFSDITNSYQRWVLWVRLVYGGLGAIVFCYLMRSGLLSSSVFPDWRVVDAPDASRLMVEASAGKTVITEWSKLVVWSFIAGFSERFVSSSLDKIDSK